MGVTKQKEVNKKSRFCSIFKKKESQVYFFPITFHYKKNQFIGPIIIEDFNFFFKQIPLKKKKIRENF